MTAKVDQLARFLAREDGLDPEQRVAPLLAPLRTSLGPLHPVTPWQEEATQAFILYRGKAKSILDFLEGLPKG